MTEMPKTEAVTDREGGQWIPFDGFRGGLIHSIRFTDGQEWDTVNGWRNPKALEALLADD